jgi:hypothetical protein
MAKNKKKKGKKKKIKTLDEKVLSEFLEKIPEDFLTELRTCISLYQTEKDWIKYRGMSELLIQSLISEHDKVKDYIEQSFKNVVMYSGRYMLSDLCDNLTLCGKCDGYDFDCNFYIKKVYK